jgi:RNA polymerase sigma factor (sigma-70 family)
MFSSIVLRREAGERSALPGGGIGPAARPDWTEPEGGMMSDDGGSVTRWIGDLKAGDDPDGAASHLWHRYFAELVRLARARLGSSPRAASDEEDVALSAFHSLCDGAAHGRFARLDDRDDLWRLLATITARKAINQARHQRRGKRGGGRLRDEAALLGPDASSGGGGLDQVAGSVPTPEFAAMMGEQCRRLIDALGDDSTRQVALLRMEGYSGEEIADRLGCNRRTVTRKLELIRQKWQGETTP